jgi:hypothetical protein
MAPNNRPESLSQSAGWRTGLEVVKPDPVWSFSDRATSPDQQENAPKQRDRACIVIACDLKPRWCIDPFKAFSFEWEFDAKPISQGSDA